MQAKYLPDRILTMMNMQFLILLNQLLIEDYCARELRVLLIGQSMDYVHRNVNELQFQEKKHRSAQCNILNHALTH